MNGIEGQQRKDQAEADQIHHNGEKNGRHHGSGRSCERCVTSRNCRPPGIARMAGLRYLPRGFCQRISWGISRTV
jgi:hypothetical protein